MYVLTVAFSKYTLILTLKLIKLIISTENVDLKNATNHKFCHLFDQNHINFTVKEMSKCLVMSCQGLQYRTCQI